MVDMPDASGAFGRSWSDIVVLIAGAYITFITVRFLDHLFGVSDTMRKIANAIREVFGYQPRPIEA